MKICNSQKVTDWAKSVQSRALQNPSWFGKVPVSLLLDKSVSPEAKVMFGTLAAKTYKTPSKSNIVSVTLRELAVLFNKTPMTISRWVGQLERGGHVERLSGQNAKSVFRLVSPVFDYHVRVETAPNAVADVMASQLPALRSKNRLCPKCKRTKAIDSTSGICAECLSAWASRSA